MTWTGKGQFWEQFDGSEMTLEWAYDGRNASWAVDAAGRVSTLELDDREVRYVGRNLANSLSPAPFEDCRGQAK